MKWRNFRDAPRCAATADPCRDWNFSCGLLCEWSEEMNSSDVFSCVYRIALFLPPLLPPPLSVTCAVMTKESCVTLRDGLRDGGIHCEIGVFLVGFHEKVVEMKRIHRVVYASAVSLLQVLLSGVVDVCFALVLCSLCPCLVL